MCICARVCVCVCVCVSVCDVPMYKDYASVEVSLSSECHTHSRNEIESGEKPLHIFERCLEG